MTPVRVATLAALAVAVAPAVTARARPATGDAAIDHHLDRAEALYREARYDEAIGEFRAAYAISPDAGLLFNIAQAYRLKGDLDQALAHYRQFVKLAPDHALAGEAALNIEQLRDRIDRSRPRPDASPRRAPAPPPPAASGSASSTGANRLLLWTGAAGSAVGVAALGVGVYYGVEARDASAALSEHDEGAWTDELLARQRSGQRAERRMAVFSAIGGAATATGAVLLYLALTDRGGAADDRTAITLAPAIGGDGVGFGIATQF